MALLLPLQSNSVVDFLRFTSTCLDGDQLLSLSDLMSPSAAPSVFLLLLLRLLLISILCLFFVSSVLMLPLLFHTAFTGGSCRCVDVEILDCSFAVPTVEPNTVAKLLLLLSSSLLPPPSSPPQTGCFCSGWREAKLASKFSSRSFNVWKSAVAN